MVDENLIFSDSETYIFNHVLESIPIFDGLWEEWISAGFTFFYQEIYRKVERFLHDPEMTKRDPQYPFLKSFISNINEFYDVDKAFLTAGGLKTRFGICWIRYKIQRFYNAHHRLPTPAELGFIQAHFGAREYEKYGYSSWERLIAKNLSYPKAKDRWKMKSL